ncbi:MAG TPA: histidinol-phosphate transaminase [Vicinamibacterales bacterium]|jgi:histidinol-phosphate aminotransferase|nr:histidinol-phosphate transaminase [Vicinamibacterales bacterium]
MPVSRRGFLRLAGPANPLSGAFLSARGLEAEFAEAQAQARPPRPALPPGVDEIRISSNENPLGPGKAALDAILGKFPEAGRYPFNSTPADADLAAAIAARFKVKTENIVLGAGSQEILKSAMRAWVSPTRAFVTALPTFENCTAYAKRYKLPLTEIKVDAAMRLDVGPMIAAATGSPAAGLVFFNNPNNPTATVHGAKTVTDMVERIRKASPDTVILIDEAYHDYVTDPSYESAVPLALSTPNVLVARTFSKAYGMAGMRIGYAIGMAATMKQLAALKMPYNISVFGVAAALAALGDDGHIAEERTRNTAVRAFTVKALQEMGAKPADSQGNFLFVDIGRPAKDFRDECAKSGVMVGRDFPPFEKSHCRISIGTMDEMTRAVEVFRAALKTPVTTSGEKGGR